MAGCDEAIASCFIYDALATGCRCSKGSRGLGSTVVSGAADDKDILSCTWGVDAIDCVVIESNSGSIFGNRMVGRSIVSLTCLRYRETGELHQLVEREPAGPDEVFIQGGRILGGNCLQSIRCGVL